MSDSPAQKRQKVAASNEELPASLFSLLSDDVLDKCFSFVGEGYYRYVGGTCRRFLDVYVNESVRTKVTFWRNVSERVPCAELCMEDQELLERTSQEKQGIIDTIGSKAIEIGKVQVLAWAYKQGYPQDNCHFIGVGQSGHVNVLEWAHVNQIDWYSDELVYKAVANGQLNVLDFVHSKTPSTAFDRDHYFPLSAAESGHIPVLEWFKQKNLLPDNDDDESMMCRAAYKGHLHVLEWLCEHGYEPSERVVDSAAYGGHIDVFQWARDRGIHGSSYSCALAALYGHLTVLQWLRENGYPWDGRVIAWAEWRGHHDVVEWARENGCPEPDDDLDF